MLDVFPCGQKPYVALNLLLKIARVQKVPPLKNNFLVWRPVLIFMHKQLLSRLTLKIIYLLWFIYAKTR